jgi:transcriptional regulator GlxA family with amidase domain
MDHRIRRLITIIETDVQRRLSLVSMARIAGLSSSRLRHKFKSEVGVTPTTYLHNMRMKVAGELLRSSELSVKQVRAAVGLESDSYFTRECRRTYGVPPSRLKASAKQAETCEPAPSLLLDLSQIDS